MEPESDGDIKCNCCARYSHCRIGTKTGGLGNKRTCGDHQNYGISKIGQNTEKSPGDLRISDKQENFETKLYCRNLIKGINTWADPFVRHWELFLK